MNIYRGFLYSLSNDRDFYYRNKNKCVYPVAKLIKLNGNYYWIYIYSLENPVHKLNYETRKQHFKKLNVKLVYRNKKRNWIRYRGCYLLKFREGDL